MNELFNLFFLFLQSWAEVDVLRNFSVQNMKNGLTLQFMK